VLAPHQVRDFAFDLRSRGAIAGAPARIALSFARALE
jgi:hypothetical protein